MSDERRNKFAKQLQELMQLAQTEQLATAQMTVRVMDRAYKKYEYIFEVTVRS